MKSFVLILLTSLNVFAANQNVSHQWCIWEGEEYLKGPVLDEGQFWMRVVYDLHQKPNNEDYNVSPIDFEGIGSCRFIPRSLGPNVDSAITAYLDKGSEIIPSRAYLDLRLGTKFLVPRATYAAGTNLIFIEKDFYSMDPPACKAQKAGMIELGRNSAGIRVDDIVIRKHDKGGVTAILFEKSASESLYYGVCHFAKVPSSQIDPSL
ncbi:MAG: hypothetical protein K2Q26_06375 [Bdellovibrionales bacterium]|nr:hypothetical protein [Bdellovibrionales bacterium]